MTRSPTCDTVNALPDGNVCMCARGDGQDVVCTDEGLDAIVLTADGDMRQAINNLEAAHTGCGAVTPENVQRVCAHVTATLSGVVIFFLFFSILFVLFIVGIVGGAQACDQPHPTLVRSVIASCARGDLDGARASMAQLWDMGYAASDIMGTLIATAKRIGMDETLRLELVKVHAMLFVAWLLPSSGVLMTTSHPFFSCLSLVAALRPLSALLPNGVDGARRKSASRTDAWCAASAPCSNSTVCWRACAVLAARPVAVPSNNGNKGRHVSLLLLSIAAVVLLCVAMRGRRMAPVASFGAASHHMTDKKKRRTRAPPAKAVPR